MTILRNIILIIFFFGFTYFTNGQNLYSLNNISDLSPTSNSNISISENSFLPDFKDTTKKWMFNFTFKPSILGFSEIKNSNVNFATNQFENSIFGLGINYFGFDLMNEFSVNVSYSRDIGNFWLGTNFSFNRITVKNFNSENLFKVDIFGKLTLTDFANIGFFINNLNRAHYSNYDETIFQNFIVSAGFPELKLYDEKIKLAGDFGVNLDINRQSCFYVSAKLNLYDFLNLKTKIITNPIVIINGVSIQLLDWINLSFFLRYQQNFNFAQTYSSEFYF